MGILRAEWQTRTIGVATHEANMSDDSKDEDNDDVEPDPLMRKWTRKLSST